VPADFEAIDPEVDPAIAHDARAFSADMLRDPMPAAPDPEVAARMAGFFCERADYLGRA
jgi:hypothetical protein